MTYSRSATAGCPNGSRMEAAVLSKADTCQCTYYGCDGAIVVQRNWYVTGADSRQMKKDMKALCNEAGTDPSCP